MVKRKTGFDQAEKAAKKPKTNRRVSRKIDLDEMAPVVKDGVILVKKGDEVYFERLKESKPVLCVGKVMSIYTEGRHAGVIDIWDETHEECYGFNTRKDMHLVKVRMFEDIATTMAPKTLESEPVVPSTQTPSEFAVAIQKGMHEAAVVEVQGHLAAGRAVHGIRDGEIVETDPLDAARKKWAEELPGRVAMMDKLLPHRDDPMLVVAGDYEQTDDEGTQLIIDADSEDP